VNAGRRGLNLAARRAREAHPDDLDDEARPAAVGATAVAVAVCRAIESRRGDAWFADPLAEHITEIAEMRREDEPRPGLICWVAVRTRFIDEMVLDAAEGGIGQVVLLGAGFDARAFRLPWPDGVRVFEIDRLPILGAKQRVIDDMGLEPCCDRRVVFADLAAPRWSDRLSMEGFREEEATCWIAEGLLVYLDAAERDALVAGLTDLSAPGSRLGLTYTGVHRAQHQLFRSALDVPPRDWLRGFGWDADVSTLAEAAEEYDRPLHWPSSRAESALLIDATLDRNPGGLTADTPDVRVPT
jgi:methyltransferase (TIGR00027 family)